MLNVLYSQTPEMSNSRVFKCHETDNPEMSKILKCPLVRAPSAHLPTYIF